MINYYLKIKMRGVASIPPSLIDIQKSKKILFAIFTRYGDSVIDMVVIKEFIERYPDKEYLILCPRQMHPYVVEFLNDIECVAFNKRNFFEMFKVLRLIVTRNFDIGFNPWSNGLDSSFFISFCNKFQFYKDFDKPIIINHYDVVRKYLKLDEKTWKVNRFKLKSNYNKILICPQSTDSNRNLPSNLLDKLISNFGNKYKDPEIVIASSNQNDFRNGCDKFVFKKTKESSEEFIRLMKENSLVVCADSGPLHIASAMKKDLLVFMRSTDPKIVINSGTFVIIDNV